MRLLDRANHSGGPNPDFAWSWERPSRAKRQVRLNREWRVYSDAAPDWQSRRRRVDWRRRRVTQRLNCRFAVMVGYAAELVIGPRFARTRWRLTHPTAAARAMREGDMSEPGWSVHPQLRADTAFVCDLPLSQLLAMNDANFPWLILVPRRPGATELFDFSGADQAALANEIALASRALKDETRCDKLN